MASSLAMGGTLRHLRDLFDDGTAVGLGDGQLLARYANARDESAFAALVARHGPMVLATCRAILRQEPDVEDAFQATFLVLARKAGSVRAGDALGGWLHRVAYRVAVQAGAESRRRRRREAEVSAMAAPIVTGSGPEPDVAAIVHEEVDRLPEKHRLPVVFCDLEGLTYEQAAGRLRCTVPTLRCRLAKARRQLEGRLSRRGITAGALGVVLAASTTDARAAVPAAMARAAIAAATNGTASIAAAAVSAAVIRGLFLARLKVAAPILLAAASLATIGVVAVGALRPEASRAPSIPTVAAGIDRPPPAPDAPSPAPDDWIEVRGRVVDPQGRPVAGAAVRGAFLDDDSQPAPEATSGPDGRFALRLPPWRRNSAIRRADAMYPWVIASAPGFGPGWASAVRPPGALEETTIHLVEDGPPIAGRVVDLEGRAVGGARIQVVRVWFAREGTLSAWLDRAGDGLIQGPWQGLDQVPASIEVAAGPDGRFRLTGLGRDRLAELLVSAPTIATAQLYAANRDGAAVRVRDQGGMMAIRAHATVYHARRFEYAAEPTQPIGGFVRDGETGRPIAGLRIHGMVYEEGSFVPAPGVEATTDDRGHYRLTGLPKGPSYRLFLEPGKGQPYTRATFRTPAGSPSLEPVAFDVALKRGVRVRGRVTDRATGRPVSGFVNAFTFADNPHISEFPGFRSSYAAHATLDADGRYEIVALPGRGIIACRSDLGRYRGGVGAEAIKGYDPKMVGIGGFRTEPGTCTVADYHVLAEINPAPGAESVTLDLQVDPGRSLTIRTEDPEGRPLAGTRATGLTDLFPSSPYAQDAPTIEVHALDPSKPRRVTITHEGRKLAASITLKGNEPGLLTVRLRPYGSITGRIVDEDGRPQGGLVLTSLGGFGPNAAPDQGFLPGAGRSPGITVGRDGRFRVEGLIPGLKYGAYAAGGPMRLGEVFRDVIVGPGEAKDLGDLKIVPPRRDR